MRHEISKTVTAKRIQLGCEIVHADLRSRPRLGLANRVERRHRFGMGLHDRLTGDVMVSWMLMGWIMYGFSWRVTIVIMGCCGGHDF